MKQDSGRRGRRSLTPRQIREIQRLVKEGLSLRKTAKEMNVSYGSVYRYAGRYSEKQTRMNIDAIHALPRRDIVGVFVGDGSRFFEPKHGHYGVKFGLNAKRDEDVASFLQELFVKAGKRISMYVDNTTSVLKVYSKKLLGFLSKFVICVEYKGKKRKALIDFKDWGSAFKLGFISGLIDADGHVYHRGKKHYGALIVTMSDYLKDQLVEILMGLGLVVRVREMKPGRDSYAKKPAYGVYLPMAEFRKICSRLISIKHQRYGCS